MAVDGSQSTGLVPFQIVCLPVVQIDRLIVSDSPKSDRKCRTSQYGSSGSQNLVKQDNLGLTSRPECPSWRIKLVREDQVPSFPRLERRVGISRFWRIPINELERANIRDLAS